MKSSSISFDFIICPVLLILQTLGVLTIYFGDIGFDYPGKYGLDFGHLLLILAMEVAIIIVLIGISIAIKKWWPVLLSLFIVLLFLIPIILYPIFS